MTNTRLSLLTLAFGTLLQLPVATPAEAVEVTFEKDSRLPLVYINLAVKAGAVTDPKGQEGLTNFLGEMMLRGTKSHTKSQIDQAIDQLGARLEVETRAEALILRGAVLSANLEDFLKIVQEIVTEPSFPEDQIAHLKNETISNLQEELGHDATLAARRFNRFLFRDHPYGKPVLGNIHDVQNFTRQEVIDHYNRLFRSSALLSVSYGDSSLEKISDWATALGKARPDTPLTETDQKILSQVGPPQNADHRRLLIVDKPDRTQTQIYAGQIGTLMTDKNFFPLHLGNYAFGGPSFSSVLMVEVRVKRGWSYGANSAFRFGIQPRSWQMHLFPAEKDTPDALGLALNLAEDLKSKGITQEQFQFSKTSLVNSAGFIFNTPKKRVENILVEKTLNLPNGFMKTFGPEISRLKLDEVNSALKSFMLPNQMAITVLGTAKNLKSSLAKAAAVPEDQIEVIPYTE